jgi:hypothetical protein
MRARETSQQRRRRATGSSICKCRPSSRASYVSCRSERPLARRSPRRRRDRRRLESCSLHSAA